MDEKKEVVDLFSLMLFEATGDSEAISELNMAAADEDMGAAEDDALSSSCDLMDSELVEFDEDGGGGGGGGGGEEEEEEEDIDQDWTDDDEEMVVSSTARAGQLKKSRVCVDSAMELMNEVEKSRLFWEVCLAS